MYMYMYMYILKVAFLRFGLKSFMPRKKSPGSFHMPWSLGRIIEQVSIPRS